MSVPTKTRVLLTGIGGFVGHHVFEHIMENTDWEVVGVDSFRHKGISPRLTSMDNWAEYRPRLQMIVHDLKAPFDHFLRKKIGKVDYVLNIASQSHVDRALVEPVSFTVNNALLMLNMLELARKLQPKVFIQMSTDEVYGPAEQGEKHKEWSPIKPSNPYSASKAAQEAFAFSYWRSYGVPVVVTNTMNIIGERQDPEKYVPMVIRKVLRGEKVLVHAQRIAGKGDEDGAWQVGSRHYLHARNLADALLFLLANVDPAAYPAANMPDRFNIVGEMEVDNLTLAEMIADFVGKELDFSMVDYHGSRPGHDLRYALDGQKLTDLGWVPPVPLIPSLENTVRWTLEHPEWLE